ncbi:MAG: DUF5615 family PIN-like protein [Caldilineaceae bacterium]
MAKFIVDECTGMAVVHFLRDQGHDAIGVSEVLPQAVDHEILQWALSEGRIVVTNDKDFGDMVFRDSYAHAGLLLLRLSDDKIATKLRIVAAVVEQYADKLANRFVVATERDIRIRPPLA